MNVIGQAKRATLLTLLLSTVVLLGSTRAEEATSSHILKVAGTRFLLDDRPFPYTGVSFFNAIYNPSFNRSSPERLKWLDEFRSYNVNVLRVWCQWDNKRGFVDSTSETTMYSSDGRLLPQPLSRLKQILLDCDRRQMVVELVLFCQESWHDGIRLEPKAADVAVATLTRELMPHRNVTFQVWNEFSERVL